MRMPPLSKRFRLTITRSTTMSSTRADTGILLLWCVDCKFSPSLLPGATLFPQYIGDVFLTFTSASCRFLKEVHAGNTLYPQLEIIKLTTQGDTGVVTTRATVHNQRGELVLDGEHTYSLKTASADEK